MQDAIFQAGLDAFRVDLFGKLFARRDESPRLSLKMTPSPAVYSRYVARPIEAMGFSSGFLLLLRTSSGVRPHTTQGAREFP